MKQLRRFRKFIVMALVVSIVGALLLGTVHANPQRLLPLGVFSLDASGSSIHAPLTPTPEPVFPPPIKNKYP